MFLISVAVLIIAWIVSGSFWIGVFAFLLVRFFLMFSDGIARLTLKDLWDSVLTLSGIRALQRIHRSSRHDDSPD
jgi:uncharacterized SAM-binding protein YcdF (DUF218 family)